MANLGLRRQGLRWQMLMMAVVLVAGCATPFAPDRADDRDSPEQRDDEAESADAPAEPDAPPKQEPGNHSLTSEPQVTADIEPTFLAPPRPTVIAIIDTGVNPYHEEFRASADARLEEVLEASGYPTDLPRLNLSLDAASYDSAVSADAATWAAVQPATLYSIPGTRIVGAISFENVGGENPVTENPNGSMIRDTYRHGTMTAGKAAGNSMGIPGNHAVLVVIDHDLRVQTVPELARVVEWVADQPWIDVSINSWGMPSPAGPAADAYGQLEEAIQRLAAEKVTLFAAGNGVQALAVGMPSDAQPQCIPDVICVGAEDNGNIAYWLNYNGHVVADGFRAGRPAWYSMNETEEHGGGTSSATAFAGGGMAELMYHARVMLQSTAAWDSEMGLVGVPVAGNPWLDDGILSRDELLQIYFHSARYPEESPDDGIADPTGPAYPPDMPPSARWPLAGYGEINRASITEAVLVLQGLSKLPDRTEDDEYYRMDQERRRTLYE